MWNRLLSPILIVALVIAYSLTAAYVPASTPSPTDAPHAPADTPDAVVASGVSDYTIAAPKLFWHTGPAVCPPHGPGKAPAAPADNFVDLISRVAIQGSLPRQLYFKQLACDTLAGRMTSTNMVADDNYVYFTTADGLYRLSVNANVGDAPELVNALVSGYAQLAIDTDHIFVLMFNNDNTGTIYQVNKSNKQRVYVTTTGASPGGLQVSYAYSIIGNTTDYFLYWLQGGTLYRHDLNTGTEISINPGGGAYITAYYAEGGKFFCSGFICSTSDLVYFSTGSQVKYYSNLGGTYSGVVYDAGADQVYDMVTDDNHIFFLQDFTGPCSPQPCFPPHTYYVVRHNRSNTGATDFLYSTTLGLFGPITHIQAASDYIFWQDSGQVLRLPKTAGALPTSNVKITGLEITQGIQKPDNSVRLIQDKRTFVRVFVQSDGAAVPGVTALLLGRNSCGDLGSVLPANSAGTNLTIVSNPQRTNLNDSFLFELPWSWTECGALSLTAQLNPYHAPPESSYADNTRNDGPFNFSVSPRLQVQFIAWQYVLFNQIHTPLFIRDILETYSWIRRAYPLNSTPGFSTDPSVGFRPGLWFVGDDTLGNKVRGSDPSCQDLLWKDKDGNAHDDRNLCASRYTNQQAVSMRAENGMPDNLFFYGMLADTKDPGNNWVFPRGQACCGTAVSSGPVGQDGPNGFFWWNGDGTYADWYAAHEIGHTLGRSHPVTKGPNAANRACGQSEDDKNYPYNYAQIGANDNTEGFDAGDPSLNQPKRIYPGTQWFDVMSYCAQQWLSDYTYEGMYQYMINHPSQPAHTAAPQSGDWLSIQGTIISGTNTATINQTRHLTGTVTLPPLDPGGYAIRLLNAADGALSNYAFTPDALDGAPNLLMFSQIVTLTTGTAKIQIVRTADSAVLTSFNVPAHAPTISNVVLQGAPDPVTGTVTVAWNASDLDGLPLTFDIFYVRNGSPQPEPLKLSVTGSSAAIDTARLGGGTGRIRVVASDGFNTAQAHSASFTMANKPPQPIIDTPGTGLHVHYGQLVNFSGEAEDFQDGGVTGSNLVWTYQKGALGTGALLSSDTLPVGTNHITLTATDSANLSASTTITVVVDDDLSLLDSTLTAGPTQFGWSFPANATTPQTAKLTIGNAGAGTLNWTATSDATWLTLSASSGTTPDSLTVTADPSGIPANTGLSGHITLIAPPAGNQLTQTITIPAGIVVGSLQDKPISFQPSLVFLPLIRRDN